MSNPTPNTPVQPITVEIKRWIVAQAEVGVDPDTVLKAMLDSGWHEDVAMLAMEQSLQEHLQTQKAQALPNQLVAAVGPDIDSRRHPSSIWAHDREVQILLALQHPRIVLLGGLLSHEECDEMKALASVRLARSETVENRSGGNEVHEARTSHGMFFQRAENELCHRVERRIASLVGWPLENGEGLQVLRYSPGAQYKPHYDYFDVAAPGTASILARGGQRVGTIVIYLNTVPGGGGTVFPELQMEVSPIKGNAVFFAYPQPHPSSGSLHGGSPVLEGEKWVATKWLREGVFA